MITPYITFTGNCRQALAFYEQAFGTKVAMQQPYGEYVPEGLASPPADLSEWVLHAEMDICGTKVWLADEVEEAPQGGMVILTATVPTAAIAGKIFAALSVDGVVTLPPTETFYCNFHAGLVDRFGVRWNIVSEEAPTK